MKIPIALAFLPGTPLQLSTTTTKTLQPLPWTTTLLQSTGRPQAIRLPDQKPEVPSIVENDPSLSFSSVVATDVVHAREIGSDAGSPVPVIHLRPEDEPRRDGDLVRDASDGTNQTIELFHSAKPPRCFSAYRGAFPLSLVVGHSSLKQALLVSAVSPGCGVLIEGRRGTGKSVLARSLHNLMPPCLIRVKNSPFNIDPHGLLVDSFLAQHLQLTGGTLSDLPLEMVATPFVTVPLGVQEDALIGSVDLEQSLETGQTAYSPGLLAKAHRGILYVDEVNLLDDEVASLLFQCLADGSVTVEREGMSVQYPCRPLLLASYNPAEGEMREHQVDRFALHVSADDDDLSVLDRVQGVLNVEAWQDAASNAGQSELHERVQAAQEEDDRLRERVQLARDLLPRVELSKEQLAYLCETATQAECEGQRGEVFAAMAAKASAALGNRTRVNAHDLELGVLLAIAPRARVWNREEELDTPPTAPMQPPDSQLTPLTPDMDTLLPDIAELDQPEAEDQPSDDKSMEQNDDQKEEPEPEPPDKDDELEEEELHIPLEFMFGVDTSASIDPRLLAFRKRARVGKGGKRSRTFNLDRGRFVRAIFPRGGSRRGHLAVGATLRAAAPFQLSRRLRMARRDGDKRSVVVTKDDFRIQQLKKKTGNLVIFVVDASGSMALNRMSAAKGYAVMTCIAFSVRDLQLSNRILL